MAADVRLALDCPPMRSVGRSSRVCAAALSLALAAVLTAACGGSERTQPKLHGFVRAPSLEVGQVVLPDVAPGGSARSAMRAEPGGLLLVYFGYTSCPDVCPTTMADLRAALGRLPADQRARVTVAMVTVDPRRDTPKVLNGYLGHFFASWRALRTTDADVLREAERAFQTTHRFGPKDAAGNYEVTHTSVVFAVDPAGRVRVEWPFGTSVDWLTSDLRAALRR